MDCCICSSMPPFYRPPRNSICYSCYEGAKGIVSFFAELDGNEETNESKPNVFQSNPSKGLANAFKKVKAMKEVEEGMKERLSFLDTFVLALKHEIHADIVVKPGSGPPISAHRAILATRSEIFKTVLGADDNYKAPAEDSISLPELRHQELRCLLEFLYSGSLPADEVEKHGYALLIAADKYDIPYLRKFCEERILKRLGPENALEVLEVSELCSNRMLKENAINSIVKHMEEVVFTEKYDAFALKNAHLGVEITRALLIETKDRRDATT